MVLAWMATAVWVLEVDKYCFLFQWYVIFLSLCFPSVSWRHTIQECICICKIFIFRWGEQRRHENIIKLFIWKCTKNLQIWSVSRKWNKNSAFNNIFLCLIIWWRCFLDLQDTVKLNHAWQFTRLLYVSLEHGNLSICDINFCKFLHM